MNRAGASLRAASEAGARDRLLAAAVGGGVMGDVIDLKVRRLAMEGDWVAEEFMAEASRGLWMP